MRIIGFILLVLGILWLFASFSMETTVSTDSNVIGGTYIPSVKINNFGKMDQRRNNIIVSCLMVLIGSVLVATSKSGKMRKCPYCAESIKHEAYFCKHCRKDLPATLDNSTLIATEVGPKVTCWTCLNYSSERFNGTKGICKFHNRKTQAATTCEDHLFSTKFERS